MFRMGWMSVLLPLVLRGEGLTLAARGVSPSYTIVRPARSSPSQSYAAEELQTFTERMTGVRVRVEKEPGKDGEAFWAGVYDDGNGRSVEGGVRGRPAMSGKGMTGMTWPHGSQSQRTISGLERDGSARVTGNGPAGVPEPFISTNSN
jgi:hypothetical protein